MDGIKPTDMQAASPKAMLPGTGRSKGAEPGSIKDAPDPIFVPAGTAPDVRTRQLEFRGLIKDMATRPPVDTSRIQALQARISAGTFTIDPARVADAMLGSLRRAAG